MAKAALNVRAVASDGPLFGLIWYGATGHVAKSTSYAATTGIQRLHLEEIAPRGSAFARVTINLTAATGAESYIDDVSFRLTEVGMLTTAQDATVRI